MPWLWLWEFGHCNIDCHLVSHLSGAVSNWLREIQGDMMHQASR